MALLTAQGISRVGIALLTRRLVLPMTATRLPGEEFSGSNGDTITVRVPQPSASRVQVTPNAEITFDEIDEFPVDVTLRHLYHAKRVSDEELSWTIEDFGRQITRIQVDAVARGAEDELATAMNDLAADGTIQFAATATAADTEATILAARQQLSENDAPPDGRWMAVSADIASRILAVDKFVRVDQSGSDNALRNAMIGRLYGFTFVESNALDEGTAYAYHTSALAFANRTPPNVGAQGADSATVTEQGIGLRAVRMFTPERLSQAVVVSTFAGAAVVTDNDSPVEHPRIIKIGSAT